MISHNKDSDIGNKKETEIINGDSDSTALADSAILTDSTVLTGSTVLAGKTASQTSKVSPPSVDNLIENGQPHFGVFAKVKRINYLDYTSFHINQKPTAKWRKQFKANQFAFIQISHPPYRICLAVASIKLASTAFAYIYNETSKEMEVVEGLKPLTHHVELDGDHYQGRMVFTSKAIDVEMRFEPHWVQLTLQSNDFSIDAKFGRSEQPLAVCSPTGRRGWTFTQKEPLTLIDGHLLINKTSKMMVNNERIDNNESIDNNDSGKKGSQNDLLKLPFDKSTLANLDWTLGYMRATTNWFWTCINTVLPDNRQFMLNLSMGVNETGTSENACWLDGKIIYLPPVLFSRDTSANHHSNASHGVSASHPNNQLNQECWIIANQDLGWSNVKIDLTFRPLSVYKKDDNYGIVASIFEQWIGVYSGTIQLHDETIIVDSIIGLAEDHFAKW